MLRSLLICIIMFLEQAPILELEAVSSLELGLIDVIKAFDVWFSSNGLID